MIQLLRPNRWCRCGTCGATFQLTNDKGELQYPKLCEHLAILIPSEGKMVSLDYYQDGTARTPTGT